MQPKIEDLVQQKDEIKSSLENLQKLKEKEEKEKFQKEISEKLTKLKKDIESFKTTDDDEKNKLNSLKSDVDKLSEDLKKIDAELKSLEAGVLSSQKTTATQEKKKDKSFRESTKEFVWEQWDKVKSWEVWKEEPWKNILRAVGFWVTWYAIVKWVKSLWNWAFWSDANEEVEEEEETSKKKKKKKWFWKTTGWKVLKRLWIWVWVWTLGYWLWKKLWWIESDEITDKADEKAEETVKLKEKDPEKYEKYRKMWENIDGQYNNIMEKEIKAWWSGMSISDGYEKYTDKNNIDKDTFLATVPMTIDNQFSDVSQFLSEWWYYAYLRGLKFADLKNEIISWWKEKIGKILGPHLSWLTSFIPFKWKDWSEAITDWLQSWNSEDREAELKLFFRQYAKTLNYTQDKLQTLKEIIAAEKIVTTWNHSTVSDALDDYEWVEEYIHNDPRYKNFVNGKLHQSIDVMKTNNIFDDSLSKDIEKIKDSSDAERDRILNLKDWKDAIQRLEEAGTNLTTEHYKEGIECCEEITDDIEDNFDKSWTYLYFWFTHEAWNTLTNNIQEFLQYSWLNSLKSGLKESMSEFKQKFASWNITQEEIKLYKDQVNSYFAMKKEILVWAKAIQQMKSDSPDYAERALNVWSAIVSDLCHQTWATLKHFKNWDYITAWVTATIPLYLWWKVISMIGKKNNIKAVETFWNFIKDSNIFTTTLRIWWFSARRYPWNLNRLPLCLKKGRYNIPHWDQLLLQDLIEWRISWGDVTKILEEWNPKREKLLPNKKANSVSEFVQIMLWKDHVAMPSEYIDILFNNKGKIIFMRNPVLREMFFGKHENIWWVQQWKSIINWYRKKVYNPTEFNKVKALEEFMIWTWWNSSIFETLSDEQKLFAKEMMESWKIKSIEEVKNFTNNIKSYDLSWLDNWKIFQLVDELIDHTDELSDQVKMWERINKAKSTIPAPVVDVVDDVVESAELAENITYKKLKNELNWKIEDLKISRDEYAVWSANYKKLDEQITNLKTFQKNIKRASIEEVEWLYWMYTTLIKFNQWHMFFDNIDALAKIMAEESPELHDALNSFNVQKLRSVIEKLQNEKKLKGLTNDAINNITVLLLEIKNKKVLKSWETLVPSLRNFLKYMGRLSKIT